MNRFLILLAAASLAACGGGGSQENGSETGADNGVSREPGGHSSTPAPASGGPSPGERSGNAVVATASSVQIPDFLHGRWGMSPADCTSARGEAQGLIAVDASQVRFYESRAVPTGNPNISGTSFSADFAFTGEGQSWTRFLTLQLQDGRLVRTESNPMASYSYVKCS